MSTGPNREDAKQAVVARGQDDPELKNALSTAQAFQLEVTKEQNRHAAAMRDRELGWLGKFIGDGTHFPTLIALFGAAAGFLMAVGCLLTAAYIPTASAFWATQFERSVGLMLAALAYIFGANSKK